jgi:hypothetical protein
MSNMSMTQISALSCSIRARPKIENKNELVNQTPKNPTSYGHSSEQTPETVMAILVHADQRRIRDRGPGRGAAGGGAPSPYLQDRVGALARWNKSEIWMSRGDDQELTMLG